MMDDQPERIAQRLHQAQKVLANIRGVMRAFADSEGTPFPGQWDELEARLEVQCLFPLLPPEHQKLLMVLGWQNQLLAKLVNMERAQIQPAFKQQWERATDTIERQYMDLVALIKKEIRFHDWPPIHRQLFEHKFSSISFYEPFSPGHR